MDKPLRSSDWIERLKRRGQAPLMLTLLDVIEPIAPALAQCLWVAQPLAGLWNGAKAVQDLAEWLEEPDGVERLRQRLSDEEGE